MFNENEDAEDKMGDGCLLAAALIFGLFVLPFVLSLVMH